MSWKLWLATGAATIGLVLVGIEVKVVVDLYFNAARATLGGG